MAKTIVQIQQMITDKYDVREIMNELTDYIQANPSSPGGGGVQLESYQNSAMGAAVMAYVFRDESDNIFRVYEPIRNNDISRKIYSYAESIDQFNFAKTENFNNTFRDVKLVNVDPETEIASCTFQFMFIDGGNFTGLELKESVFLGSYAFYNNLGEIVIKGNNVVFEENWAGYGVYFNEIGANSLIKGNFLEAYIGVECGNFTGLIFQHSTLQTGSSLTITENDVDINTCQLAAGASLSAAGINGNLFIGTNKTVAVATSDLTALKNLEALTYNVNGNPGSAGGTFTNITSITVENGIITDIQGT